MVKCLWLALWVLSATVAQGQSADDVRHVLETALKGKQLPIRGFLGEPVIRYALKAGHLEAEPEQVFTLGIFRMDSVKVHAANGVIDTVSVQGHRRTLMKSDLKAPSALSNADARVSFEIDLRGADAATLSGLAAQLFYPDTPSALNDLPPQITKLLPMFRKPQVKQPSNPTPAFSNQFIKNSNGWVKVSDPTEFKPLKEIFAPELKFSEEATRALRFGNVRLALSITDRGVVNEVWLIEPVGLGLDEQAIGTAALYRFDPAMYAGKPVGVEFMIELGFEIYH